MKRFFGGVFSGLFVWGALLFSIDVILGWDLRERINLHSKGLWASFGMGFATSLFFTWWLGIWKHFGHSNSAPEDESQNTNSVSTAQPIAEKQPVQPAQDTKNTSPTPVSLQKPVNVNSFKPASMPTQTKAVMNVDPTKQTQQQTNSLTATPAVPAKTQSQKDEDILTLSKLGSNLDMMAFKHVALEGKIIDLVYSSDDVAVLCRVLSDDVAWSVDTTQPVDQNTWTSDAGMTVTPCLDLLTQAAILEKMEQDATIIPTIVLVRGSIQNYTLVQDYLLQNHITLVQYQPGGMDNVQTLEELLNSKFIAFPSEDEEEEQNGEEEKDADETSSEKDNA